MTHTRASLPPFPSSEAKPDDFSGFGGYDLRLEKLEERPVIVVDDWPQTVPINASEIETIERYLGPLLDAFLRPSR